MRVLLTRPAAQSQVFADSLDGRFDVVISPVIEPNFLNVDLNFDTFDAVVFTSQNGVSAFERLGGPKEMQAFCVGAKTAKSARKAGLIATSADGDIHALNAVLAEQVQGARLLHICGVHTAGEVLGNVTRVVAYDQIEILLNSNADAFLSAPGEVLLPVFSARSGQALSRQIGSNVKATLTAICLSEAIAASLDKTQFDRLEICSAPTAASMRDKMSEIFPA